MYKVNIQSITLQNELEFLNDTTYLFNFQPPAKKQKTQYYFSKSYLKTGQTADASWEIAKSTCQ